MKFLKVFGFLILLVIAAGGGLLARPFVIPEEVQPTPAFDPLSLPALTPFVASNNDSPRHPQEASGGSLGETPTPEVMLDQAPIAYAGSAVGPDERIRSAGYYDIEHYRDWERYAPLSYCEGCPSVFIRRMMPIPLRYEGARGFLVDFGPREGPEPWEIKSMLHRDEVPTDSWSTSRTYYMAGVIMPTDDSCAAEAFNWILRRLNDTPVPEHRTFYSESAEYEPQRINDRLSRLKILTGPRPAYPINLWDEHGASINEILVASGYALAAPKLNGSEGDYANAQRYAQDHRAGCLWE